MYPGQGRDGREVQGLLIGVGAAVIRSDSTIGNVSVRGRVRKIESDSIGFGRWG